MGKQPSIKLSSILNLSKIPSETRLNGVKRITKITKNVSQSMLSQITEQVFVSDYKSTCSKELLKEKGVDVIINVSCKRSETTFPKLFHYQFFFIEDRTDKNIIKDFKTIALLVDKHVKNGKRVLIHCRKGISRAPTFVMAYLILFKGYSYEKAFDIMKKKHKKSDPNFGFLIQLEKMSNN